VRRQITWKLTIGVAAFVQTASTRGAFSQSCPQYSSPSSIGTVQNSVLTEASGLAASRQSPGVLWSHNDSLGANAVYALGLDGASLGTFTLSGSSAIDWEDIAIGPGPASGVDYLYVGDIGDNFNIRPNIRVYRVPEPTVDLSQPQGKVTLSDVETITLAYPDGSRDAETLMIDVNGDMYIVTKRVSAVGRVYRAAFPQATSGTITLEFVGEIPWGSVNGAQGATAGDIARDGSAVIVRRLSGLTPAATLWRRAPGTTLPDVFTQPGCDLAMPPQPQGEAICFAPEDLSLYTLSEGRSQPIFRLAQIKIPGDVNGDDLVDVDDLVRVILAWGACAAPPMPCPADMNPNGEVDVDDLIAVILNWT
jgi:hypothetical protein